MTEITPGREVPLPTLVPALLSFVAGSVDSYTYLTLFGLFVAQVTSSFVIAGADLVTHDYSVVGKLLVLAVFLVAATASAALIAAARHSGLAALPRMLALEALLLAIFVALIIFGPRITSAADWHGIAAGLIAAAAMGMQSVLVRLLMKDIPQTNVMTGNMTQLGIKTAEIILVWRRCARDPANRALAEEFEESRAQLMIVLAVAAGFLIGVLAGVTAFATTNVRGALVSVAIVGALALWAAYREKNIPSL